MKMSRMIWGIRMMFAKGLNTFSQLALNWTKPPIFVLVILTAPVIALASDWRVHLSICNQDVTCAKEQAVARDLWDSQDWTPEFKESCRKQYIQMYAKDYRAAVKCVAALEEKKQEFELREAEINRKEDDTDTNKTIIIKRGYRPVRKQPLKTP